MQCLLHLSQKLKQEPLSVPTQKLVDKLVLAAQVRGFSSTAPLTGLRNWPLHIALLFYLWLNVSTHQQWDLIVSLRALQSVAKEESVRKQREEMLVTFIRKNHSSAQAR